MGETQLLPLAILKASNLLKRELPIVLESHSEYITPVMREDNLFRFEGAQGFFFVIDKPEVINSIIYFRITQYPKNAFSIEVHSGLNNTGNTLSSFKSWAELMQGYEEELNLADDPFYAQTEKEVYDAFEFVEEDDDITTSFSIQKQLVIYNILEKIEMALGAENSSNPEIAKLINYSKDFKGTLHTLPKSIVKKRLAKLFTKIRKFGIKLFFDTLEVGYKELIKYALKNGTDSIGHFLS